MPSRNPSVSLEAVEAELLVLARQNVLDGIERKNPFQFQQEDPFRSLLENSANSLTLDSTVEDATGHVVEMLDVIYKLGRRFDVRLSSSEITIEDSSSLAEIAQQAHAQIVKLLAS